ncbi:dystrobrevin-1 [Anopheles arabiensis]|uniref:ZZ-type domain-containing protein n=1 Tax=Anopheles arabiensis TaxID=7173 RepID=A0A8W7MH05_ANOAR|nr:dystrobrevin-1 [Anopheles arabiensis]
MMYDQQIDERGYLVYRNRYNGKTEQDNPNLLFILLTINEKYAGARYSTYRCAGKLHALQKALHTSYIPFEMVHSILNRHQLNLIDSAPSIKPGQLASVVHDVYFAAARMGYFDDLPARPNLDAASALLAGFLWAVFDPKRTTPVSVLELRQAFLLLCDHATHGQLVWEHFRLTSDHNLCVSRHRFEAMLTVLSKVLTFLGEPDHLRPSMVQQITGECFANYPGLVGLTEYQFCCLWKLSSLFSYYANVVTLCKRLHDTEHITHGMPCYGCRAPIRGLRFKCQRCRHVSLCLDCFTAGYSSKRHSMAHKMYEISAGEGETGSRCTAWAGKVWRWLRVTATGGASGATTCSRAAAAGGGNDGLPSAPSTYENLEAKLIDTKAVDLGQSEEALAGEPDAGGERRGTAQRRESTISSTLKRNMSLFSSVEYGAFNNTQQKNVLARLAATLETLEERHEATRIRLAKRGEEGGSPTADELRALFEQYVAQVAEGLAQLKDIGAQLGQGLPQCSSTPYRQTASLTADCSSEVAREKSMGRSRIMEKTELSVRDISTWFHIELDRAQAGETDAKEPLSDERPPPPKRDELSCRIDRLKMDTQMANFRDLLLKVREIVDDSYSDNTELARSTQQIEKALDRIIAEEEQKRAQQSPPSPPSSALSLLPVV